MDRQLNVYENMGALSSHMLEAAQANDWDRLSTLERQVASLRDHLMSQPAQPVDTDEAVRARKIALIRQILADDREIRSHAEPWMESVKGLLSGNARQRAVKNAYGVNG